MACDYDTIRDACCDSQICRETDEISLLQITAQAAANWVVAGDPTAVVTPEAILERACDSGIGKVTDETELLNIIAQNLCNQIS
jgi:hypothetical protein